MSIDEVNKNGNKDDNKQLQTLTLDHKRLKFGNPFLITTPLHCHRQSVAND